MPRYNLADILCLPCLTLVSIYIDRFIRLVFRNATTCFLWAFLLLRLLWAIHKELSIFTLVNLQTNLISV